jgi:catechol-2,3-dioxygenase
MSIQLDHVVVLIENVNRTEKFYSRFLGKPLHRDKESISYQLGQVKLFLGLPYTVDRKYRFDKDRIGLNHLAFGVQTLAELKKMGSILSKAKIKNSGILSDKYSGNPFIWFDDPDGMRLEFYFRNMRD